MNQQLPHGIVDAIKSDEISGLIADLSDVALSVATDSELLDSVPIVSTLRGLWKAGATVRDAVFVNQVRRFLTEVSHVNQHDRENFAARLEASGEIDRFGEAILLLIEKADEVDKPTIIGRILAAHMRGYIPEYLVAMRLAWIVNRSHTPDLLTLKSFVPGLQHEKAVADSLFAVGLLHGAGFDGGDFGVPNSGGTPYEMSEYATLLVKYGLT